MSAELCPSCGSGSLYQFAVTPKKGVPPPNELPQVCRSCASIIIDGEVTHLPKELGSMAVSMSKQAEARALTAREQLEGADEDIRIESWLQNFFKAAYMDGFIRALAYWNHHGKEGRLVRIRKIWNEGDWLSRTELGGTPMEGKMFSEEMYTELEKLINFSPGAPDGQSPSNKNSPV